MLRYILIALHFLTSWSSVAVSDELTDNGDAQGGGAAVIQLPIQRISRPPENIYKRSRVFSQAVENDVSEMIFHCFIMENSLTRRSAIHMESDF